MEINVVVSDEDVTRCAFIVEKTSDRQGQAIDLADSARWPGTLAGEHTWQHHRWDMFFVDVLLPVQWDEHSISFRQDGRSLCTAGMQMRVARFFIRPNFQNPAVPVFADQPGPLVGEDCARVKAAAQSWFIEQPACKQMAEWGLSAMRSMRNVLVLADKFDADWWGVFEDNTRKGEE